MKKFLIAFNLLFVYVGIFAQTALPTSWNFSTPGISTPPNGWTLNLGTNGNLTYAFGIGDNLSCKLDATGENFVIRFGEIPGPLSYYLSPQNAGAAWGGQFDVQESIDGNTWNTLRSVTYKATTTTNYTNSRYVDYPASSSRYVRFFYTNKLPGGVSGVPGGNMGVDSVWIQAAPAAPYPGIVVKRGTTALVNGTTSVIGNVSSTTFTIENKGTTQTLIIDSVKFTGTAASDYSVSGLPMSISGLGSSSMNVGFNTSQTGSRKASMYIYCNDTVRSPFVLNLYGIGGNYATEPLAQPNGLYFSNITSYSYLGSYTFSGTKPEYFLVLKKLGAPVSEAPTDGITYKRGDFIGSAQVEKISDTNEVLNPNYVLANSNYHYAIFSFNGPAGYENYLSSNPLTNSVVTPGKSYDNYYNGISPSQNNFVSLLTEKIKIHDTIYYSNNIPRMVNPWLARDTTGGKKIVNCVYTGHAYIYDEPFLWANGTNGAVLTREHTFCQSWMPSNSGNPDWPNAPGTSKELPEFCDVFNLFPAHQANANLKRSNNPFGMVVTPTYVSPTGFGKLGKDSANQTVYEPRPEHKGDAARALFYMLTCYNGSRGLSWALPANQSLNILRQWNQMDPPDNMEIARHEFSAAQQGNRNPFIDHPEWADRINFYNMSYIPMDSSTPKSIHILKPTANDIWQKGKNAVVSWNTLNIDSLVILFSTDSLKTTMVLNAAYSAQMDSFQFMVNSVFAAPRGIVIVKDKHSSVSDTSDYFSLSMIDGLVNYTGRQEIQVYPNPVLENMLHIVDQNSGSNREGSIYDLHGKLLYQFVIHKEVKLNLEKLEAGIYILKISDNNGEFFQRIVKQ